VNVKLAGLGRMGTDTTNSLQEFHRLNSPYINEWQDVRKATTFADVLKPATRVGIRSSTDLLLRDHTPRLPRVRAKEAIHCRKKPTRDREGTGTDVGGGGEIYGKVSRWLCFKYEPETRSFMACSWEKNRRSIAAPAGHCPRSSRRLAWGERDSGGVRSSTGALPKPKVAGVGCEGWVTAMFPFHRTEFTGRRQYNRNTSR